MEEVDAGDRIEGLGREGNILGVAQHEADIYIYIYIYIYNTIYLVF